MHDIIFTAIKLVIMVLALVVSRYLIPWIRERMDASTLEVAINWVGQAVLFAQQTMSANTGEEKKAAVASFLEALFAQKGIDITEDELNVLIEAAVKEMKMETIIPESEA